MDIRNRIIQGAANLFFSQGIRRVTMDDIATELGMSKRTIYENFKDKTEILNATEDFFQAEHDHNLQFIMERSSNVMEVIIGILRYGIEGIKRVNPLYLQDLLKYFPKVWNETVQKSRDSGQQQLQHLLERGKAEGLFRENINTKLVSRIFYEQISLIHSNEAFPIEEFPRKELFENMFLNFARGISTYKGIEVLEELLQNIDLDNPEI
jgi:AcrR family transcriptional regulator